MDVWVRAGLRGKCLSGQRGHREEGQTQRERETPSRLKRRKWGMQAIRVWRSRSKHGGGRASRAQHHARRSHLARHQGMALSCRPGHGRHHVVSNNFSSLYSTRHTLPCFSHSSSSNSVAIMPFTSMYNSNWLSVKCNAVAESVSRDAFS